MNEELRMVHKTQTTKERYKIHGFDPIRIESITEQLRQICYSGCHEVLEIGIAGGFLRHCFKLFPQISHKTLDIAEDIHPDYVGSVTNMPFDDKQFDVVVCGEVLEHLPFTDFLGALKEIRRVARHKVILSLPDKRRHFGFAVCLARFGWFKFEWNPTRRRWAREPFKFDGEHYWEIGCKGTFGKDVVKKIKEAGFKIEKQYRLWKHPWHHFFILRVL